MDIYAIGTDTSDINKCICLNGYKWNDVVGKCRKILAVGFEDDESIL